VDRWWREAKRRQRFSLTAGDFYLWTGTGEIEVAHFSVRERDVG